MEETSVVAPKKIYYGWWIVLAGFLIMATCHAPVFSCASLFIKPVCESMGYSRSAFTAYITLASIGTMVISTFMGRFQSMHNMKRVMLICSIIFSATFWGFSFATQVWHFYVLGVIQTVSYTGFGLLTLNILINNWFGPKKKGLALSITFAGSGIGGMVLSPLVTDFIIKTGWRSGYRFIAIETMVFALPIILFMVVNTPAQKGLSRLGEVSQMDAVEKKGMTFAEARKTAIFWCMVLAMLLHSTAGCSVLSQGVAFLTDIGYGPVGAAKIYSICLGLLTLGKVILGIMNDRLGACKAVLISSVMLVIMFLCMYLLPNAKMLLLPFMLFYAISMGIGTVTTPLVGAALFGDKDYGTIMGVVNMTSSFGNAVGVVLAARIFDVTASYSLAWMVMLVLAAMSVLAFWMAFAAKKKYYAERKEESSGSPVHCG